jgi:hypothetical protein
MHGTSSDDFCAAGNAEIRLVRWHFSQMLFAPADVKHDFSTRTSIRQ